MLFVAIVGLLATTLMLVRVQQRPSLFPSPMMGSLTAGFAGLVPMTASAKSNLGKDLVRAGCHFDVTLDNFLAARNTALLCWILFAVCLIAFNLMPLDRFWIGGLLIGMILLFGLPRVLLSLNASNRTQRICSDLPDALDLLAMMMSGGMTMPDALNQAIGEFDETHPALANELKIISRQSRKGSIDQALINFAERIDVPEVSTLTAMLRGGNQAGGSLVDLLRTFSDELRHYRDQRARERGNKASIKLLLPVVFCLAPPIYILLLGPAFLDLKSFVEKENQPGGALAPAVSGDNAGSIRPVLRTQSDEEPVNPATARIIERRRIE